MGRMNDKQVTIITAAAMALVAIGLGAATYFYFLEKNQVAKDELAAKQTELAGWAKKETELNGWKKQLPELLKADEERIDILPTKEERKEQEFHNSVYAIARESNAIIRSSTPVAAKAAGPAKPVAGAAGAGAGPWEKVTYKYRVEGEFYNVASFLSRIEGMKRFVKVVSVQLTPNPKTLETREKQKLTKMYAYLNMEVNFFFLK